MRRIIESVLVLVVWASVAAQTAAQASSPSAGASGADTIYVAPPTGQPETDRARVQEAFDRVGAGDTVLFAHGTYVLGEGARLTVPDVTVLGHPDGTVLRGCDPERFELAEGFGMDDVYAIGWACTGLFVLADRQIIRGLTFDHTWHGIYVGHLWSPTGEPPTEPGFGGHRIENNVFRHVPNGIRVVGPTDVPTVIRDNEVVNAYHAFQSNGAIVHVIDNRITVPEPETVPASYYPESGVMLSPGPASGSCEGSRIVGNVVDGTVHGIQVIAGGAQGTCSDHEIRDNVIRIRQVPLPTGYPRHLRDFYFGEEAEGPAVAGTAIRLHGEVLGPADGGAAAITNVVIQDNRVVGGDGLGIQLASASGNRIVGNHISAIRRRSPFPGLTWGDDPNRWRDANGSGIWISPGSDGNEIVGNTFEDVAGAAVFMEGDDNVVITRSADDEIRDLGERNRVGTRTGEAGEVWTPPPGMGTFLAVEPMAPVAPVRAEGGSHLFYELRLASFDPRVLELDSLQVLDGASPSNVLASYTATELREMIEAPGRTVDDDPVRFPAGSHSVVFLWLGLGAAEPPSSLRHRLFLHHGRADERGVHRLETDPIPVSRESPLVVGPPLRGGPWYAHAGPANASHHRRTLAPRDGMLTMDQRFASDWILLEESVSESGGALYPRPDWAGTFGSEVLSVADGRVAAVVDGIPDDPTGPLRPGEVIDWHTVGGNRVIVDLGAGRFAWYHHLQAGSPRVRPGDVVRRGQVLGLIGNSGNSGAPHLHFEITDSDTLGKGRGLPFVFECFDLMARAERMPGWGALEEVDQTQGSLWDPPLRVRRTGDRRRSREIPLGGSVVLFPDTPEGADTACGARP